MNAIRISYAVLVLFPFKERGGVRVIIFFTMRLKYIWKLSLSIFCGILFASFVRAAPTEHQPKIIVIIDNLGIQQQPGLRAAHLPQQVACSILPHMKYSAKLAQVCHEQNKVVILNTPMQALNGYPLGPGGLYSGMSKADFIKTLESNLASVPFAQGLDNQMGSQLTAQTQAMTWLLQSLKSHGLFFVDNLTSPHSVAGKIAKENNVLFLKRDIFLDNDRSPASIQRQFNYAIQIAKRHRIAVVVAHAYPNTLDFLANTLPHLDEQGVQLVSIAQALNLPTQAVIEQPIAKEQSKLDVKKAEVPVVVPVALPTKPAIPVEPTAKPRQKTEEVKLQPLIEKSAPIQQVKMNLALPPEDQTATNKLVEKNSEPIKAEITNDEKKVVTENKSMEAKKPSWWQRLFHHKAKQEVAADKPKIEVKPAEQKHDKAIEATKKTITEITKGKSLPPKVEKAAETKPATTPAVTVPQPSVMQKIKAKWCNKFEHFCKEEKPKAVVKVVGDIPYRQSFAALQSKLNWPTAGIVVTRFGTDLGSNNLRYNGVLIQGDAGQPVRAVYQGRIVFANWLHGLGLLLIIDHGDGYMSLYGHNQAIYKKVGDVVKPHELIAAVGNSGEPGPTGLYFEIRHDGVPVNPENWCH